MSRVAVGTTPAGTWRSSRDVDDRPPGERYYRHPGDVVRLVVWASVAASLVLFVNVASSTREGVETDLAGVVTGVPEAARQLLLAVVQIACVLAPLVVLASLAVAGRWRRAGTVVAAAAAGVVVSVLLDAVVDLSPRPIGFLGDDSWLISTRFPSPPYLAAAFAVVTVGKPWLSRAWRRAADASITTLAVAMAIAGSAGVPALALGLAAGGVAGAAILVAVGAPNRRPTPLAVGNTLRAAGLAFDQLELVRATGGRSQLYRATSRDGDSTFVKVFGQDSRDADLLYRYYRAIVLRDRVGEHNSLSRGAEHEALVLVLARRAGVTSPALRAVAGLSDASMLLAMDDVAGRRLDELAAEELTPRLLEDVWQEVAALHDAGLSHGALRAANVLVTDDARPVLIDFGSGAAAADRRDQMIDRAELVTSLASLVGPERSMEATAGSVDAADLAGVLPFLQPLALSAATRRRASKTMLRELRERIATATGSEQVPLERLIRVRLRTIVTIVTITGAFYLLLPQLANVDDSIEAIRSANWGWLAGAVVMSGCTYAAGALSLIGGVRERLPFATTVQVSLASSFVNRVTPANVGGMALNVRYLQKTGVPPAEAVTGVGLNVVAGGIAHAVLLVTFFTWAGRRGATAFALPSSSTLLVVIVVVLAIAGVALTTRWGRRLAGAKVLPPLRQSLASIVALGRSPSRLVALFGGSFALTVAYITALAFAAKAFDAGADYAQVGAVYLGASLIAAAAPTPGGLGAIEAALVAGFTGIGVEPAIAVATVLSYRLVTYWLPILPGWACFRTLDRRNYI